VALSILSMTVASSAGAQDVAGSFDQLRVLIKAGDTVTVTDASGAEVKGKIAEISSASLVLLAGGNRRELHENDVTTIRQRRDDRLANGAAWGFGIGGGLGLLLSLAIADEVESGGAWPLLVAGLYGGIGTGIGVGVDALIKGQQVIYAKRASAASTKFTVSPIVGAGRRGVQISLGLASRK
jgi:hypothetical protein